MANFDQRHGRADALETVPDPGRDRHQSVVGIAEEQLDELPPRRRLRPLVVHHQLDGPDRNSVVDRHAAVEMPRLDGAGIDRAEIDFAEAFEMRRVGAEHVHDRAAFVRDPAQRCDRDSADGSLVQGGHATAAPAYSIS